MKKTVITQIIERLEDAQKHIMANTDYAIGYDGALSDAVTVCESFLENEILETEKFAVNFVVWLDKNKKELRKKILIDDLLNEYKKQLE
jgi:hypothetical protein